MRRSLEYRIMWNDDGHGNAAPGPWAPIDHAFDHRRRAQEIAGTEPDGLASIWVADASNVEFRWRP